MSTAILPSLAGLGFDVVRSPQWDTVVQQSLSGKETRFSRQNVPRWSWELTYNVLRSTNNYTELQQLAGFFNARQGKLDSFLYRDADDNMANAQPIGVGNGTATSFPLVRSFGGFIEPVLAPGTVSHIYLDGANQSSGWSASSWGSVSPGIITFLTAPASGVLVTADLSYYFPVRMSDDSVSFAMFLSGHYKTKKFGFISVKG